MDQEKLFDIKKVSFFYDTKKVINRCSITLAPGRFYGIMGPNGCGKSTLVDLIINHRKPDEGNIKYKGGKLSSYSKKALSREIALVPQNFYINFPFTAGEIVMMGRYPHMQRFQAPSPTDTRTVLDIMEKTETLEFEHRYITELSGGERQRVIFARALAQKAPVLVLDEATSNMDINHAVGMMNMAAKWIEEEHNTVISVMQDINLAAIYCDELIFMHQGQIAEHGPVAEVLNSETLRSVFRVESKIYFDDYAEALQVVFKKGQ